MAIIEGIGDEVIQFFILLVISLVALIAWWSTRISERPYIRTVLIVERRSVRHAPADVPATTAEVTEVPTEPEPEPSEPEPQRKSPSEAEVGGPQGDIEVLGDCTGAEEIQSAIAEFGLLDDEFGHPELPPLQQEETSVLRNRRLAFFQGRTETLIETSDVQSRNEMLKELIGQGASTGSQAVIEEEEGGEELGAESGEGLGAESREGQEEEETEAPPLAEGNIRIRLKYLNDDQKLVEGRLLEPLGDFKKRHFSLELAGRKLVRLIFNGQVLQQDSKTLQNYGLFDNCVVHCLVHQPRTPPPSPNLNRTRRLAPNIPQTWDLGNLLFASLSLLLGLAWYGRYQYAQLYTATTTVALVGLTGIFTVSLIGMYMPDAEGLRT